MDTKQRMKLLERECMVLATDVSMTNLSNSQYVLKQHTYPQQIIYLKNDQDYNTEIKVLKKLQMIQNDYVIKIFDIIQENNQLYIFMEEQTQGDLSVLIRKRREKNHYIKVDEVLKIIKQIARGYKILYMQQIIHRDLKPSNILKGNNGLFQITDFGLCKFLNDMSQALNHSRVGTRAYSAPQIFESAIYSSKCDMYSLGAIIYELIYGKPLMDKIGLSQIASYMEERRNNPVYIPDFQTAQFGQGQENEFLKLFLQRSLQFEESDRLSWEELFQQIDVLEVFQTENNNNQPLDITLQDIFSTYEYEQYILSSTTDMIKIIQIAQTKLSFLEYLRVKQDAFYDNTLTFGIIPTYSFYQYQQKLLQAHSYSIYFNLYHFLFNRDNELPQLKLVQELQNTYEESVKFFIQSDDLEVNNYKHYIQQFYLGHKQQLQDELKALANDENFQNDLSIFYKREHYLNYSIFLQAFQQTLKSLSNVYNDYENKEFVEYMAFSYRFLNIQNDFSIKCFRTANSQDILYFQTDLNYLKDYVMKYSVKFN